MVWGLRGRGSLTMTYFHTGIRTIIGAKAFHCPVRDGKEWYHLAMVIRHNGLPQLERPNQSEFIESGISVYFDCAHALTIERCRGRGITDITHLDFWRFSQHRIKVIGSSRTSN